MVASSLPNRQLAQTHHFVFYHTLVKKYIIFLFCMYILLYIYICICCYIQQLLYLISNYALSNEKVQIRK